MGWIVVIWFIGIYYLPLTQYSANWQAGKWIGNNSFGNVLDSMQGDRRGKEKL